MTKHTSKAMAEEPGAIWGTVFLGSLFAVMGWLTVSPELGAGVLAGMPISVLNALLKRRVIGRAQVLSPLKAHNLVMRHSLIRMAISFAVLISAVWFGAAFLVGVLLGLTLEMFGYMLKAVAIAVKRG